MADLATLEIQIGAEIEEALNGLENIRKSLDSNTTSATRFNDIAAKISSNLDKVTSSASKSSANLLSASTGIQKIAESSNSASQSVPKITNALNKVGTDTSSSLNVVVKGFDSIEAQIEAIARSRGLQPFIESLFKAALAIDGTDSSLTDLQRRVSQFGGGVFNFDVEGITKAIGDTDNLTFSLNRAGGAIKSFPDLSINIAVSNDLQASLNAASQFSKEIQSLGIEGTTSVTQLTKALQILRTASSNTVDINVLHTYNTAIEQIETDISKVIILQQKVSQFGGGVLKLDVVGIQDAIRDTDKLTLSLSNVNKQINTIPPLNLNIAISNDLLTTLNTISVFSEEIKSLGIEGVTSLDKLIGALKILRSSSAVTLDTSQFALYKTAIEQIESELTKFITLQNRLSQFGGGVVKFDVQGVSAAIQNVDKLDLTLSKVSNSIQEIPPVNLNISFSKDLQASLNAASEFSREIQDLGLSGSASVTQLTDTLKILRTASSNTVDQTAIDTYEGAIKQIETELTRVINLQKEASKFGGGILKLDVQGIPDTIRNTEDLNNALNRVKTTVDTIPDVNVNVLVSKDLQTSLSNASEFLVELRLLGSDGSASVGQLTNALEILRKASENPVSIQVLEVYKEAITQIESEITRVAELQNKVSQSSGGVIKLDVQGVTETTRNTEELNDSLNRVKAILNTIPDVNVNVVVSKELQTSLDAASQFLVQLKLLGSDGSASVGQLTQALEILRKASENTVDIHVLQTYETAIKQIESEILKVSELQSKVSQTSRGVIKLDVQGVTETTANADLLNETLDRVKSTINTIPDVSVNVIVSKDLQVSLSDASQFLQELKLIGSDGSASVGQLTEALGILRRASENTVDLQALQTYDAAIKQIESEILKIADLQSKVSQTSGGTIKLDVQGIPETINGANLLNETFDKVKDTIKTIPPAKIDVIISGDVQQSLIGLEHLSTDIEKLSQGGTTSILQLERALSTLRTATTSATDVGSLARYNVAIEKITGEVTRLRNVTAQTNLGGISKGSSEATFALTNLGRVVQDLPFGFIGIANNLNPLLESFQRLRQEAKLTGASVGSLLTKSLTGAGGLGIALSVVSAALVIAQLGMSAWTRGFGSNKKAVDEAKQSNEDYKKSLEEIGASAIKNAEKQIADLTLLTKLAQDNTLALEQRIEAASKLQEQSGYFAALSKEEILYGNITDAINLATQALLNKAYASAALDKAAATGARAYELDVKRRQALVNLTVAQQEFNQALKDGQPTQQVVTQYGGIITPQVLKNLEDAKKSVNDLTLEFSQTQIEQLTFQNDATKYTILSDNIDKVRQRLAQLDNELKDINKKSVATGGGDFNTEKISSYKKAIEDLLKLPQVTTSNKDVQDLIAKVKALGGSFTESAHSAKTSVDTIAKVLSDLNNSKREIDDNPLIAPPEKDIERIKAIEDAVKRLIAIKIPSNSTLVQKLVGEVDAIKIHDKIQESLKDASIVIDIPVLARLKPLDSTYKTGLQQQLEKNAADIKETADKIAEDIEKMGFKLPPDFFKLSTDDQKKLDENFKNINDIVEGAITGLVESLAAIGEGDFKGFFSGIFTTLGKSLEDLGKYVIVSSQLLSKVKAALNAALSTPFGEGASIALGIGLIALGKIIENIPKFSKGGIVPPGYPNDTYPAFLTSGEVIVPANTPPLTTNFNQFTRTTEAAVFIPENRISGNDIVTVYKRVTTKNKRTF